MATRRSRRQLETSQPSHSNKSLSRDRDHNDEDDEDIAEDEETTRCVCEFQDYPGPPLLDTSAGTATTRNGHKSSSGGSKEATDGNDDEPGSLFIQCESCEVWQHGGCVGIMSDEATPDNYFCELCRPDFHHIDRTASGQRFSRYVPIESRRNHRKLSGIRGDDVRNATRDTTKAGSAEAPKRRSTMNSRATLDEDEQLRKALEISKQEGGTGTSDTSHVRKSKRGREDSEDIKPDVKRQRTHSSEPSHLDSPADSTTDLRQERRTKTPRSVGPDHNQREGQDPERRLERQDTASKHRSRRRGEEAEETGDEKPQAEDATAEDENGAVASAVDAVVNASNDDANTSRSANATPQPPSRSNAPNSRKRGRNGKMTGAPTREGGSNDTGSPAKTGKDTDSPRENARDGVASEADSVNGTNGNGHGAGGSRGNGSTSNNDRPANGARRGRPGRDRNEGPRELSLTELKRRAAAMLEFISRSQKEMADAEMRNGRVPASAQSDASNTIKTVDSEGQETLTNGSGEYATAGAAAVAAGAASLADDLATRLVKWQQEFTGESAAANASDA